MNTSWDILRKDNGAEIQQPWSDTYWPLMDMGLANRWMADQEKGPINGSPLSPGLQFFEMMQVFQDKKMTSLAYLSPGEKYDLVKNQGVFSPGLGQALKAIDNRVETAGLLPLQRNMSDISKRLKKIELESKAIENKTAELATLYLEKDAESSTLRSKAATGDLSAKAKLEQIEKESKIINANLSQLYKQLEAAANASEAASKDYELAFTNLLRQQKPNVQNFLSSAQMLSKDFFMLGKSWQSWASFVGQFNDNSWGWMGHCHGWASASLFEAPPKHAVMVEVLGAQILFTEGDLRGLLTKVWADQPPKYTFVGQRCESETTEVDKWGRSLDGVICSGLQSSCTLQSGGQQLVLTSSKLDKGMIVFSDAPGAGQSRVGLVRSRISPEVYQLSVFPSLVEYQKAVKANDYSKAKSMTARMYTGCRDTNPMTLHLALYEQIKNRKRGFIFDKDRFNQVWNQPVFKYALTHQRIRKKNGTLSAPGEPVRIEDVDDAFANYRAKGTMFLVQLQNKVSYGVESAPAIHSRSEDDFSSESIYNYTLELDKNQRVIGGEWGVIPSAATSVQESAETFSRMESPDFIWTVPDGLKPTVGPIDFSLIDKLHKCSLQPDGIKTINLAGKGAIPYTDCKI
ncbi:MAG: hypothetical protein WCI18_00690 [Pseudomonadota bacterium]